MNDDSFKNTLPGETDDHPDSGMPRQLRTQADGERALTREEAGVAGMTPPGSVYGESSSDRPDTADRP
jgi:hypothetical protein